MTTSPHTACIHHYELTNHLGNVSVIVSDKKLLSANRSQKLYLPEVISYQDYYPFGMLMTDRSGSLPDVEYRYGYNGKENDNEVKGEDNQQDYGFRVYDQSVGRFLRVDARGELLRPMAPLKPNGICQQKSPENDITFCQIEIGLDYKFRLAPNLLSAYVLLKI